MNLSGHQRCYSRRLTTLKMKALFKSRETSLYFSDCYFSGDISSATRKVDKPQNAHEEKVSLSKFMSRSELLRVEHHKFLQSYRITQFSSQKLSRGRASSVQILEGRRYISSTPILNPKALRNMIDGLCHDVAEKTLEFRILSFFSQSLQKCMVKDTAALFQAFKHLHTKTDLGQYTSAIALHLHSLSHVPWTFKDLSEVISGLQYLDETGVRHHTVIRTVAKIVSDTALRGEVALKSDVQRAMEVWKRIELSDESSLDLVRSMAQMVDSCQEQFDPETLQSTMIAFQGMSSRDEEVELLLSVMASKIRGCQGTLSALCVSVCLASLRRMTSESTAVLNVLRELAPFISSCQPPYNNNLTARALFGLQGMSSDHEEVRLVLLALLPLLKHSSEPFSSHDTGIALFGLQNMSCNRGEVRSILTSLKPFITSKEPLEGRSIGESLCGLRSMKSGNIEVDRVIEALVPRIQNSKGFVAPEHLAKAFYGLQNKMSIHRPVKSLLEALVLVTLRCTSGTFSTHAMSKMIYALQGMYATDYDVRNLLFVLRHSLLRCDGVMSPPLIAAYLKGLQNMTDFGETHGMLGVACAHLRKNSDSFGSDETSDALLGLKNMTADYDQVRETLRLLAPRLRNDIPLDAKGVTDSIRGLVGMSSEFAEVCEVVRALVPRIQSCEEILQGYQVASILRSMQSLDSKSADVRSLVSALVHHMQRCSLLDFPQKIGTAIMGLQGMSGEHLESQQLMTVLAPLIVRDIKVIDSVSLGHIVYGLQNMYSTQAELLRLIEKRISQSHELEWLDDKFFHMFSNRVLLCLPILRNTLDNRDFERWDLLARRIKKELSKRDLKAVIKTFGTKVERRLADNARIVAMGSNMEVSLNKVLCGLFECDVVLTVPLNTAHTDSDTSSCGDFFILNLEVDGHKHLTSSKMRYDKLRDDYMSSVGIQTRREEAKTLMNMSDGSMQRWIKECLANAVLRFELSKTNPAVTQVDAA